MKQLLFPLLTPADYSAEAFVPTAGSAVARAALAGLLPSGQPHTLAGLLLVGEAASGKTHVGHIWQAGMNPVQTAWVDNLEQLDKAGQEALFHTFNRLKEQGGALLVTSQTPLPELPLLPDLASRLATLQQATLQPPNEAELTILVAKWAAERQLVLAPAVVTYLMARAERSPAALRGLVQALDELSLEEKRAVTVPLVKRVLEQG